MGNRSERERQTRQRYADKWNDRDREKRVTERYNNKRR